jgi:septation ring formation regulator EzrA
MLGAMAKRTLQMTRGIETFSAIEMRLDEGLANQLLQREMLAANEIAMVELNEMLDGLPGEVTGATANALTQTQQALASELQQLQEENKTLGQELNRLQKALDAQAAEVSALRGVRRELSTLRSSMQQVESTVGDLYIIERARVAKQVLSVKEELPIQ